MLLKCLLGFAVVSAIAIPGTIYVAKPEIFGLGDKEKPNSSEPGPTKKGPESSENGSSNVEQGRGS